MPRAPVTDALWGLVAAVRVTEVASDGPADEAGVEVDDVIIAIDGIAPDTDNDLAQLIRGHDPGDEIILTIVRRGEDTEVFELELTLGRDRDDQGEMVTYLGIWYRPLGSAARALPRGEGSWD
jgi:S1-C subfamily serine protease